MELSLARMLSGMRDRCSGLMASSLHFVVPGPLDQRTGGYIYDRRIVEGLRARGWNMPPLRRRSGSCRPEPCR